MATASDRVAGAVTGAEPGARKPPLRRLADVVADASSLDEYFEWADRPFGRLMVASLRDLALWGSPAAEGADVAVQHGMSLGLALAARLLEDPTSVMPPRQSQAPAPSMDYKLSPEDFLEKTGDE